MDTFNLWDKTVLRNSLSTSRTSITRDSHDLSFMFVVYVFDLIANVWFVFILLVLEVHALFW